MDTCIIWPAVAGDLRAITSIYDYFVQSSTATFEIAPPDLVEMDRRRRTILDRKLPYLVAELKGYIVGYTYASPFRPREAYRFTVGSLIAGCQSAGCHRMVACICGDNPASVALHLSMGFQPVGNLPEAGYKFDQWIDMAIMQRAFLLRTQVGALVCVRYAFTLPSPYVSSSKTVSKRSPTADSARLVAARGSDEDDAFELKLRPHRLGEFIGQTKAKEQLAIALKAAKSRGEALDHVLLFGPPGLGKTTLATIIANELEVGYQQTSGPALQIQGDLTAILTNLRERQVLFLDEIHRLQPVLEEKLYTALEDYKLDIIIGQGPSARTHVMEIRPFTFVAATTRPGLLSSPLRSRFGILLRLEFYTDDELRFVVTRSAEVLGVPIDQDGAAEIAMRSRGTPRIANRLLRRVRDYAEVRANGRIDRPIAQAALSLLEVDAHGFDELDRRLLRTIIEKYDGGPVGLNTLAAALAEEQDALEEVYEPFLIQIGFLDRTPRGRVATRLAYEHLGIEMPRKLSLF